MVVVLPVVVEEVVVEPVVVDEVVDGPRKKEKKVMRLVHMNTS